MYTKLTLRLDEQLIQSAKKYAQKNNTSLSRMVADYFGLLLADDPNMEDTIESLPPITRSLVGILSDTDVTKEDYYQYLEEKHQ